MVHFHKPLQRCEIRLATTLSSSVVEMVHTELPTESPWGTTVNKKQIFIGPCFLEDQMQKSITK